MPPLRLVERQTRIEQRATMLALWGGTGVATFSGTSCKYRGCVGRVSELDCRLGVIPGSRD